MTVTKLIDYAMNVFNGCHIVTSPQVGSRNLLSLRFALILQNMLVRFTTKSHECAFLLFSEKLMILSR